MTKKIIALMMILALAMSFVACTGATEATATEETPATEEAAAEAPAAAEETVTLSLAHIRPEGSSADIAIKAFAAEATELSGGTLQFEIYPASQLGEYTVVQERVMIGDVDMQIASIGTNIDKLFGMSNAAYLCSNWEEAKVVFSEGSPLIEAYRAKLDEYGLTYLCGYPLYFGGIALAVDPVDPTNPNASNGIKIRVPSMTTFEKCAETLGYLATPLASSETFTAIQTGVVDGAIGMGAEGYYSNMADLIKYYLPINDHFEQWYMYINSEKFNALSQNQQEALTTAAANLQAKRWETAEAETAEYEQKFRDAGTEVVEFTDEQLAAFAAAVREKVWPLISEEYGIEIWEQATAAIH
ncbi:MAG: TRAP transporter substrate-binding protein DctP [Candidatus Pelethousia sp.]|nr:TRAP transporter substrate-binding protein DctP [Candidatus Pelethousia sp.]